MKKEIKFAVLAAALSTSPVWIVANANTVDAGTVSGQYDAVMAKVKVDPETKVVVSRSEIEGKGAENLAQALAGEQDVQPMIDAMGKRTVSIRGSEPRQVLFLVDGRRIASGLSKIDGPGDDMYRIGMDDVDHIVISRGATAAKYGSDAMGGVINVVTKVPDKLGVRTNMDWSYIESGRESEFNHTVSLDTGKVGPVKAELSWGKIKTAPYLYGGQAGSIQYYGLRYPNKVKGVIDLQSAGKIRIDYDKLQEHLFKTTDMANSTMSMGPMGSMNVYVYLDARQHQDSVNRSIAWSKSFDKVDVNLRHYTSELWNDSNFMVGGKISMFDSQGHLARAMQHPPVFSFDTYHMKLTVDEGTISYSPNNKHRLNLGIQRISDFGEGTRITVPGQAKDEIIRHYMWPKNNANAYQVMTPGESVPQGYDTGSTAQSPKYINHKTITSNSFTLSDDMDFSSKLHGTLVLRYDTNSQFGNQLSPKFGLTYLKSNTLRYKANIGTAFTAPGITELYHDWEMYPPSTHPSYRPGWYFKGNPDLKAEKAVNFDLSVESERGKTATKLTVFRNTFRDFLQIAYLGQIESPGFKGATHEDDDVRYYDAASRSLHMPSWDMLKSVFKQLPSDDARFGAAQGLPKVKDLPYNDDLYTYTNIGHARMQGIELAVTHQFSKKLTATAGYTYLDARDTDTDKRLEGRGRNLFNLSLQYKDVKHGFRAMFYGTYTTNFLDPRDHVATGRIINTDPTHKTGVTDIVIPSPMGAPVIVFANKDLATAYATKQDVRNSYVVEKKTVEKNYGVWNLMIERDLNKNATVYAGVNNMFGASDEFLGLGGRIYRMGLRMKF